MVLCVDVDAVFGDHGSDHALVDVAPLEVRMQNGVSFQVDVPWVRPFGDEKAKDTEIAQDVGAEKNGSPVVIGGVEVGASSDEGV